MNTFIERWIATQSPLPFASPPLHPLSNPASIPLSYFPNSDKTFVVFHDLKRTNMSRTKISSKIVCHRLRCLPYTQLHFHVDKELKPINVSSRASKVNIIYMILCKISLVSGYPNDPYIWRPTVYFKHFWISKYIIGLLKAFLKSFFYKQNVL